jgi:alkylresorcinol/alkylpyrone synthase
MNVLTRATVGDATGTYRPAVPRLLALATAVPPNVLSQAVARDRVRDYLSTRSGIFDALAPVYANAEIDTRYLAEPLGWYATPRSFAEKCDSYARSATAIARDLAERCLADAGLRADEIDAIVCVSSTGILTPSLDARLMNLLPFRRDTMRVPLFGLGCAGGVLGLSRASELAAARPGRRVLLLVIELCSLAIRHDRFAPSNVVAMALFGDGAAAAIIASDGRLDQGAGGDRDAALGTLGPGGEHCWQDTLDIMGWNVDGNGLDVVFHRSIPAIVANDYASALAGFLDRDGLRLEDFVRTCCHPGGIKVVEALEDVFALPRGALDAERDVLRNYGNMSAPTVLFVLQELIGRGVRGKLLLSSLGPGFAVAFQVVDLAGGPPGPA